jgi:hypothetical protein
MRFRWHVPTPFRRQIAIKVIFEWQQKGRFVLLCEGQIGCATRQTTNCSCLGTVFTRPTTDRRSPVTSNSAIWTTARLTSGLVEQARLANLTKTPSGRTSFAIVTFRAFLKMRLIRLLLLTANSLCRTFEGPSLE